MYQSRKDDGWLCVGTIMSMLNEGGAINRETGPNSQKGVRMVERS